MLTVVNQDNTFSGVQYDSVKQEFINHHKQYGQKLIWLERAVNTETEQVEVGRDEEGKPIYEERAIVETATAEELAKEVESGQSWKEQNDPATKRVKQLEQENLMLMFAVAEVYEELIQLKFGGVE